MNKPIANSYIQPLQQLSMRDVASVGGKNASLGEMLGQLATAGVRVPDGYATTTAAFMDFLAHNDLKARIQARLEGLDVDDVRQLAEAGREIRGWVTGAAFQANLAQSISAAYAAMAAGGAGDPAVAVRSSATAEDLPDASFAGQQETFLNVCGIDAVLHKVKAVYASLYNDRAIAYRAHKNFDQAGIALSATL